VIDYHTAFAAHKMTLPTLQWLPTNLTGSLGSFQAWDLSSVDAEAMVNAFCTKLAALVPATTSFDLATAYTQATPTSDNIPVRSVAIGTPGTLVGGSFPQAVSCTMNFKTLGNGDAKVVILDTPLGASGFLALHAPFASGFTDVETELTNVSNAWSGRDDTRISTLRKVTFDLNDRLQKQYRMSA
jgi:hypothetical protein